MTSKRLTPAMREWEKKLKAGYSIRPHYRRGPDGYPELGPGLYNPEGAFVQNVRRDTVERLWQLGVLTRTSPAVWAQAQSDETSALEGVEE